MEGRLVRNLRRSGRGGKLVAVWEFISDPKRIAYCEACRRAKKKAGKQPPCASCENARPPALNPHNEDALELWNEVNTQWRGAGFGIIGLDYGEVRGEAERLEIELSHCTFRKIKALERFELKRQSKQADPGRKQPNQ